MQGKRTIIIIGEEEGVTKSVKTLGFRPIIVGRPREAVKKLKDTAASLVLINLPGRPVAPGFLRELSREGHPILLLADPDLPVATLRFRNGKVHVLTRPVLDADLDAALRTALGSPASRPKDYLAQHAPLLDHSPAMRAVRETIEQVADTNATVLIRGESGVGKELVARAIHSASPRHDQPFVKVNCAALPTELLESELFGHDKGAFTGAYRRKLGKFEFANKGTLFLDEIGELPLALQAKLLHVLQDQEFSRVGGREMIRVDTRVLASTNRNLEAALGAGQFREDLYYRLNVVEIHVPPLRERREEIPALLTYLLEKFQRQYDRQVKLPADTARRLTEYAWPGNVRELENIVRRLVVLGNARQIQEEILTGLKTNRAQQAAPTNSAGAPTLSDEVTMGLREIARRAARDAERRAIQEVLDRVRWNRTEAARRLKISYKTLLSKIAECGLAPKQRLRA